VLRTDSLVDVAFMFTLKALQYIPAQNIDVAALRDLAHKCSTSTAASAFPCSHKIGAHSPQVARRGRSIPPRCFGGPRRPDCKHSAVRQFEVELWGRPGEIDLTVSDSGAGFDVQSAREGRGLGLMSMQERLQLLKGTLLIESQPQRGSTIHAHVPLSSERDSMRAVV
jgi:hypothetical protein